MLSCASYFTSPCLWFFNFKILLTPRVVRARGWRKDRRVARRPKQPKTPRSHNEHSARPPARLRPGGYHEPNVGRGLSPAFGPRSEMASRHLSTPPPGAAREPRLDPAPGPRDALTSHYSPPPLALLAPRGGSCLRRSPKAVCKRSRRWCSSGVSVTAVCSNRWLWPPGRDISGPRGILSDDCTEWHAVVIG